MPETVLVNWTDDQSALMEKGILLAQHRLQELPIFTDDGLARLLDMHPREDLNVYTMGHDHRDEDWRRGDINGYSGEKLLEALRKGRLWINVLRLLKHHQEFRDLVDKIYRELEGYCPDFRSFRYSANLLISSPTALVCYHADAPLNMLWHLRGKKRAWVYPLDKPGILSPEAREGVFAPGEEGEELPYHDSFDQDAEVFDLLPGQMLTWPQNTPHRIVNQEGLNVSLSTEHYTPEARRRQSVYLANRTFRRWLPLPFDSERLYGPGPLLKVTSFRILRRIGLVPTAENNLPATFKVDLQAPDCVANFAAG